MPCSTDVPRPDRSHASPNISFHSEQWAVTIASSAHFMAIFTLPLRNVPPKKRSDRLCPQRSWMPDLQPARRRTLVLTRLAHVNTHEPRRVLSANSQYR